jgi:hypothetical protein
MTRLAAKKAGAAAARSLTPRETDALKIARDLARQAQHAPKKVPHQPQRSNRYVLDR